MPPAVPRSKYAAALPKAGMSPDMQTHAQTHTLLRLGSAAAVCADTPLPDWAVEQLSRAPWVVVRRERARAGCIAVGVRGCSRSERFAGWVHPGSVEVSLTPL